MSDFFYFYKLLLKIILNVLERIHCLILGGEVLCSKKGKILNDIW